MSPTTNNLETRQKQSRLKEGDVVAFTFRGDSTPSTAAVVRVRETRTKTDAGDTVVTIHYDVAECETAATAAAAAATGPQAGDWTARAPALLYHRETYIQQYIVSIA